MGEDLSDGWGRHDAADDTLVRAGALSLADRVQHHAASLGRRAVVDDGWVAGALADQGLFSNAGVLIRPPDDWSWVAPALEALAPRGTAKVLVSPFPTPDLRADGLELVGHPPFMVRPAGDGGPPPVPGLEIREVDSADDLVAFERTLIVGYPMDGMDPDDAPILFPPPFLGGASRVFLGTVDGVPVATAAAHVAAGVNHVEFVATLPQHRGAGIGAALTWAATVADPTLPGVLIASDDGRRLYEALGYLAVSRWTLWLSP